MVRRRAMPGLAGRSHRDLRRPRRRRRYLAAAWHPRFRLRPDVCPRRLHDHIWRNASTREAHAQPPRPGFLPVDPRLPRTMRVLTLDAALARCSAAIVVDQITVALRQENASRGHAALLPVMTEAVLEEARLSASDLDLVAVTVGPGSFTGI